MQLRKKCPNTEISNNYSNSSSYSCIRTEYGKYGPEKTPYLDAF